MFCVFYLVFFQEVCKGNQFIEKNISSENKLLAKFFFKNLEEIKKVVSLQSQIENGAIAQLVEQRTENPCVPGSIPGGTT